MCSWGLEIPCKERNALLLPPRRQFKERTVFPVPHLCIAPHLHPWGWGRWKGLLACVMLDALLHAAHTFLCPRAHKLPSPDLSALPGAPGLWGGAGGCPLSLELSLYTASLTIGAARLGIWPLAKMTSPLLEQAESIWSPKGRRELFPLQQVPPLQLSNFPAYSPGSWESSNKLP